MQPIGVELRVVGWAATVERIEIECRRTALDQFVDGDLGSEHGLSLVHRQVVVDELTQIGESGWDLAIVVGCLLGHRFSHCLHELCARRRALRSDAREAELPDFGRFR